MSRLEPIKTSTDLDGDVVMSDAPAPSMASKDRSIFDWFSFEAKTAPPKSPTHTAGRPVQDPDQDPNLSASTASPSTYFTNSPFSAESKSRHVSSQPEAAPPEVKYPPLPPKALKWVWQCHLCSSRYPLAVTRRCLVDGHYYCSGNSQPQRNVKKRRKNQSCTSEFDYVAWKEWGQWRRKTMALRAFAAQETEPKLIGCEGCSSPSQCRYESRKKVEVIKFDDFIDEEDLVLEQNGKVSSDPTIHQSKSVLSKRSSTLSPEEEKDAKSRKSTIKKGLKLDSASASQDSSGRSRFYSSLTGSLSNRDLSPTSESLGMERGRFDPTLPSVSRSASKEKEDLTAIESTLKATLRKQKQRSSPSKTVVNSSRTKRRLGYRKDGPEPGVAATETQEGPPSLQGTMSQPNLLTDLFRQSKVQSSTKGNPESEYERAASEAEITAFLGLTPSWDTKELKSQKKKHSFVPANNTQHFEEVDLSGSSKAATPSNGSLLLNSEKQEHDSSKGAVNPVHVNEGESARGVISFGLSSLGFGRK